MFQINATSNEIVQLVPKRFSDLGREELRMVNSEWRMDLVQNQFVGVNKLVERREIL